MQAYKLEADIIFFGGKIQRDFKVKSCIHCDLFSLQKVLEYSDREATVRCGRCMKVCTGETLRYNDQLFHAKCLVCLGKCQKRTHIFLAIFLRHSVSLRIACHLIHSFGTEIYMFEIHVIFLSVIWTKSGRGQVVFTAILRD